MSPTGRVHVPALQTLEQALPHAPQFVSSPSRSTHRDEQTPGITPGQMQAPATHVEPAEQTLSHVPQLALSLA